MTLGMLIILAFITCMVIYLCQQGVIPAPFNWIAYAIVLIVWLVLLLRVAGMDMSLGVH